MKYYALAYNENGETVVIANLPENYMDALIEAENFCYKKELYFKELRPVKGTEKQPEPMCKHLKKSKTAKGDVGYGNF